MSVGYVGACVDVCKLEKVVGTWLGVRVGSGESLESDRSGNAPAL